MTLAVLKSRALAGMAAPEVTVEVHLAAGLPGFTLVGLPDTEVREARDRVRAAIQNSNFEFPARRITVNLAPADLPPRYFEKCDCATMFATESRYLRPERRCLRPKSSTKAFSCLVIGG